MSLGEYVGSSKFWFESFQNWQSEFLSVGVLIVLSIFLRQKGSPQSKEVDGRTRGKRAPDDGEERRALMDASPFVPATPGRVLRAGVTRRIGSTW